MSSDVSSDAKKIEALFEAEYRLATYIPLRDALVPFLCQPFVRMLSWSYGNDQPDIACWIVADLRPEKEGMTLAYCEAGHGAYGHTWGIVMKDAQWAGRDDSWFLRLEDAFISAGVWHQPLPEEYEIR